MRTFKEMEDEFYRSVRRELLKGMNHRPPSNHLLFKRMYAHKHLEWSTEKTIANMPRDRLDWAMQQVARANVTHPVEAP